MGKMFAGGYWKRSYPKRTPIAVHSKVSVPEPTETIQNDNLSPTLKSSIPHCPT